MALPILYASGSVPGAFIARSILATDSAVGSGAIKSGSLGDGAIVSGSIASGQISTFAIASGAITSGLLANNLIVNLTTTVLTSGVIVSGYIASGQVGHFAIAVNAITSGQVGSGTIMGQAGGGPFNIASGTINTNDLGNAVILSGNIGSGQVAAIHLASGFILPGSNITITPGLSGYLIAAGGGGLSSGAVTSGYIGNAAVVSGDVASGAIIGQAGGGYFNIGSGTINSFDIASGGVRSGNIASGQIGSFALASGIITSGVYIGSGTILGQAGGGPFHIASGTIGPHDIASGTVTSGLLASGLIAGVLATISGDVVVTNTGVATVEGIQTYSVANVTPTSGQSLVYIAWASYGMISWWLNNPTNSVTTDSYDSNALTNTGPVTSTTGFGNIPSTASFNGSSQYLSVANNSSLQTGNINFWVGAWFNTTTSSQVFIAGKSTNAGDGEWSLYLSGGLVYFITMTAGGINNGTVSLASFNDGGWHFAFAYQDIQNNIVAISVDGGAFATSAITVTAATNTQAFTIGASSDHASLFPGDIGPVIFGKPSIPIAGLVTSLSKTLYNLGNGLEYTASSVWLPEYVIISSGQLNGAVVSGQVLSGSVKGHAGGGYFTIASGTINTNDIGSGAIQSGQIGSGQVGPSALASGFILPGNNITVTPGLSGYLITATGGASLSSGVVVSGDIGNAAVVSGSIASGQISTYAIAANTIVSGQVASGAIMGQAGGGPYNIASGTINSFDIASGGVRSGNIASGQIGHFAIGSGAVQSGQIASGVIGGILVSISGDVVVTNTGVATVKGIQTYPVANTTPLLGQIFVYTADVAGTEYGLDAWWLNNPTVSITADSYDSNTLTNNGSVTSTTGFGNIPSSASFNGSTQFLTAISNSTLQTGNVDFWIAAWFKTSTAAATPFIAGKTTAGGNGEYCLFLDSSGNVNFQTIDSNINANTVTFTGNKANNSWHFAFAYQDIENGVLGVSVDGAAFTTNATTLPATTNSLPVTIGCSTDQNNFFTGDIGSVLYGKPSISISTFVTSLMTTLYNGGNGIEYASFGNAGWLPTSYTANGAMNIINTQYIIAGEALSGALHTTYLPVAISSSGYIVTAAAGISGRCPTIGLLNVSGSIASGQVISQPITMIGYVASGAVGSGIDIIFSGYMGNIYLGSGGIYPPASGIPANYVQNIGIITQFQLSGTTANILVDVGMSQAIGSGLIATSGIGNSQLISVGSGLITNNMLAANAVVSGQVGSGTILGHAGGGPFTIASGTISTNDIASGGVQSGNIASGQIGTFAIASGGVLSGNIGSGQVGHFAIAATAITSGQIGSGTVMGHAGGGVFTIASGTISTNDIASGGVQSGNIASGQIGSFAIASGIITSGVYIGSGTILGQAGGGPFNIASGTINTFDHANNAILSGNLGSGQVAAVHISSGTLFAGSNVTISQGLSGWMIAAPFVTSGVLVSGIITSGYIGSSAVNTNNVASGLLSDPGQIYGYQLIWQSTSGVMVGSQGPIWNKIGSVGTCRDSTNQSWITLISGVTVCPQNNSGGVFTIDAFQPTVGTVSQSGTTVVGSSATFTTIFQPRNPAGVSPTISSSATTVTGTNTWFLYDVCIGDLIGAAANGWFQVTAIASNTSLTIANTPGSAFSSSTFTIIEQPTYVPVAAASGVAMAVTLISGANNMLVAFSGAVTAGANYQVGPVVPNSYMNYWACQGTSGATVIASTQRTQPYTSGAQMLGYNQYFRRLGAVQMTSGKTIRQFDQRGTGNRRVYKQQYLSGNILVSGEATSGTAVTMNNFIPPTADEALLYATVQNTSGINGVTLQITSQDGNEVIAVTTRTSGSVGTTVADLTINTAQSLTYQNIGASGTVGISGNAIIYIRGYVENI